MVTENSNQPGVEQQAQLRRKNRIIMIGLIILFASPVLVALWSFNNAGEVGFRTKNRGDLIRPARPLQPVVLENINTKEKFELSQLQKNWVMLYFVSDKCDEKCFADLVKIRQSRLAQGGELMRINRVIVLLQKQNDKTLTIINKEHIGSIVVTGKKAELAALVNQFEIKGSKPAREARRIYLIDPLGNLMLKFEPEHTAGEIVKDLKRLLYVSQVG